MDQQADSNEQAWMAAAGRGDRDAFARLVERHHRAVLQLVARLLPPDDRQDAEDLAQDVFLAAWQAAPRYRPTAKVSTWLFRIAANRVFNHRRARRWRAVLSLSHEAAPEPLAPASEDPAVRALAADELARLEQAMATLPANQRAALVLRHEHDLSYTEIAEVLGTSVPAVESLLFRARRALQAVAEDSETTPQVRRARRVGRS